MIVGNEFCTEDAASFLRCWGAILIYNFPVLANVHGRYRRHQPLQNKLIFPFPRLCAIHSVQRAAFLQRCARLLGTYVSCQSNIRGWWWGIPHAYISADKGAVTTSSCISISYTWTGCISQPFPWYALFCSYTKSFWEFFSRFNVMARPSSLLLCQTEHWPKWSVFYFCSLSANSNPWLNYGSINNITFESVWDFHQYSFKLCHVSVFLHLIAESVSHAVPLPAISWEILRFIITLFLLPVTHPVGNVTPPFRQWIIVCKVIMKWDPERKFPFVPISYATHHQFLWNYDIWIDPPGQTIWSADGLVLARQLRCSWADDCPSLSSL